MKQEIKNIYSDSTIEMEYLKFGKGEKSMVILPGLNLGPICLFPEATASSLKQYADEYTCYLFDRKNNLEENASVHSISEDTFTVIENLGLKEFYLYGASFGGMIGLDMALHHPDSVLKFVPASTICRNNSYSLEVIGNWISMAKKHRKEELISDMIDRIFSLNVRKTSKNALFAYFSYVTNEMLDKFVTEARTAMNFDVYEQLPEIKCPMLAVGCENDRVLSVKGTLEIHEKTGAPMILYGKEYSHNVYDEAPDFKKRVLNFFKG